MANNKNITFNQLEASMTKVKAEIDKKANTNHGTHVPTTGTANNATYLRNDNQWHKIVPSDIGAAPISHGDHVTYSSTSPSAPGTASAGSAANVSRGDHVHPLQTSVSGSSGSCTGNAATATKLKTARNIALTGTITGNANFDGSGNISIATSVNNVPASGSWFKGIPTVTSAGVMEVGKYIDFHNAADGTTDYDVRLQCNGTSGNTVDMPTNSGILALLSDNVASATRLQSARKLTIGDTGKTFNGTADVAWTLAEIGAAASSHTHSYIPLSGSSSITGNLEFSNSGTTTRGIIGTIGDNDYWRIVGGATASNAGYLEIATADDANEPIYVRQYGSGKFGTLTRTATLLDGSGNTFFPGTVTAPTFKGALNGNASTATKLQTARSINGTNFDGTANITTTKWGTARTLTIGNSGKSVNGSGNVSWSLDEMGVTSAIAQSGNSILNTVSNTYATKAELNGLDIGGRNYLSSTGTPNTTTISSLNSENYYIYDPYTISGNKKLSEYGLVAGDKLTVSFDYKVTNITTYGQIRAELLTGDNTTSVYVGGYEIKDITSSSTSGRYVATLTLNDSTVTACKFRIRVDNGKFTLTISNVKMEKGDKATAWTPAPEDIDNSITTVDNKFVNYSTTNQMNSAIQVAENDAKMDIRHNYVTKHEAAHYFEGENKWKLDVYSLGSMSASATPTKELMIQNNCQYQRSILVEHPNYQAEYADNYVGYATTYMHFTEDHQWTGQVATDDNGSVYLNDEFVLSTPTCQWTNITLNFKAGWNKLEVLYAEGGGGDGWQFSPEISPVDGGVLNKMNCYGQNSIVEHFNARTLTIGNTGKNFDGTGNISWSLDEIGAAPSSHGHNFMYVKGTNTIGSVNDDTTANWGAQGNSVHWYAGVEGLLHDQPSSWGYLVNIGQSSEVHQVWMTQASGDLLHRGGNSSGWNGSWKTILDTSNYSNYVASKSHTHTNLVTKTVSNSTLTLGTELYQYAAITSNTTINLPSVSSFTEIHLFFNWPSGVSITMPSNVKWQQGVMYGPGHVHEFVFTYVNNIGWLGGCVVYG